MDATRVFQVWCLQGTGGKLLPGYVYGAHGANASVQEQPGTFIRSSLGGAITFYVRHVAHQEHWPNQGQTATPRFLYTLFQYS